MGFKISLARGEVTTNEIIHATTEVRSGRMAEQNALVSGLTALVERVVADREAAEQRHFDLMDVLLAREQNAERRTRLVEQVPSPPPSQQKVDEDSVHIT